MMLSAMANYLLSHCLDFKCNFSFPMNPHVHIKFLNYRVWTTYVIRMFVVVPRRKKKKNFFQTKKALGILMKSIPYLSERPFWCYLSLAMRLLYGGSWGTFWWDTSLWQPLQALMECAELKKLKLYL